MSWILLGLRTTASILVTVVAAPIPAAVRLVTRGALYPSAWVGSRTCRIWARVLCAILGVRIRVLGMPPIGGVFVVVANHLSYLDVMVLGSLYPSIFVAKREIGSWPIFGIVARGAGTLFVDRGQPKDVVRVGRDMRAHLGAGIPLTLFPEGRSSRGSSVLPFMPSLLEPAARAGVPCYAASLSYETPGTPDPPAETVCWHDSTVEFLPHILRMMRIPRIEATVSFAENPYRSTDRKELAQRLWEDVRQGFVPVRQGESA